MSPKVQALGASVAVLLPAGLALVAAVPVLDRPDLATHVALGWTMPGDGLWPNAAMIAEPVVTRAAWLLYAPPLMVLLVLAWRQPPLWALALCVPAGVGLAELGALHTGLHGLPGTLAPRMPGILFAAYAAALLTLAATYLVRSRRSVPRVFVLVVALVTLGGTLAQHWVVADRLVAQARMINADHLRLVARLSTTQRARACETAGLACKVAAVATGCEVTTGTWFRFDPACNPPGHGVAVPDRDGARVVVVDPVVAPQILALHHMVFAALAILLHVVWVAGGLGLLAVHTSGWVQRRMAATRNTARGR